MSEDYERGRFVRWAETWEERLRRYTSADVTYHCHSPLPKLDEHLNGGLVPGAVGLVLGRINAGKSAFAAAAGFETLHRGGVVIHATTEESAERAAARYHARLLGIPRDRLLAGRLHADEVRGLIAEIKNYGIVLDRLSIWSAAPGSRVDSLQDVVREAKQANPNKPLLLIVDSLDGLTLEAPDPKPSVTAAAVIQAVKALAMDHSLSVWATAQASRKTGGFSTVNTAARYYSQVLTSDVVLGLECPRKVATEESVQVDALLLKNRFGRERRWRYCCTLDVGTCRLESGADSPMVEPEEPVAGD